MNQSNITEELEVLKWRQQAYSVAVPVFVAICILVMVANLCVLVTLRWLHTKLTPTLRLTVSLAISDVWTSTVVAVSMVFNSYLVVVMHVPVSTCVALTFEGIRMGGLLTGCFHLLALSVNHYLLIVKPFLYPKLLSSRRTIVVIVLLWLVPPTVMLTFFASLEGQGYRSEEGYCLNVAFFHRLEFRLVIFLLICLLLVIMSVLYLLIFCMLNRLEKRFSKTRRSDPCSQQQQLSKKRKVLTTSLIIWGTFLLGWVPSSVIFVLTCATCPYPYSKSSAISVVFATSVLANFCILIKSLINPVIYAVRIPEIRGVLLNWVHRGTGSDSKAPVVGEDARRITDRGDQRSLFCSVNGNAFKYNDDRACNVIFSVERIEILNFVKIASVRNLEVYKIDLSSFGESATDSLVFRS
ncbi:putative 7 transmembrane receptor [Trichinella nativa]|uniref:Putative 7 transmembrane receptor n=1 Tax=Trichinella nativa TaxID=6335 RepID=A0A1Y3ET24_9BILA|nr:putative 7 transmembrane receptor [Trichinella nativa]